MNSGAGNTAAWVCIAILLAFAGMVGICSGLYLAGWYGLNALSPPQSQSDEYRKLHGSGPYKKMEIPYPHRMGQSKYEWFKKPDGKIVLRKITPEPAWFLEAELPRGWHDDGGPELVFDPKRK